MRVGVLGAGAWGTSLAALLAEGRHDVALWEIDSALAARLHATRESTYLGIHLPPAVAVTDDLAAAVRERPVVLVATPSEAVRSTLARAAPDLPAGAIVI